MGSIIGGVVMFIGIILMIGNKKGWWPTLSFSGIITMLLGYIIIKVSNDD